MTIEELSAYYKYSIKIKALSEEIEYMRGKTPGLCAQYGGAGGRSGAVSDSVGNMAVSIADKVSELEKMKVFCELERAKISDYIFSVNDPLVSGMMYARFILLKSWHAVAMYVGGGNTADSCRMAVFRYCGK